MKAIGERIRTVRGSMSQDDFSQKIGVSKAAVGAYERNAQKPGSSVIIAIYNSFKIEPKWLLLGEGPMLHTSETIDQQQTLTQQAHDLQALTKQLETTQTALDALKESLEAYKDIIRLERERSARLEAELAAMRMSHDHALERNNAVTADASSQ